MSQKTEHKKFAFKLEGFDQEQGEFSGYAAVFGNIDSGGDVIAPGAFTKSIAEGLGRVKILALHNDCELPIGLPLELREDAHGLFIRGRISDTSMGRDVKTLLRDGVLNEMSIGYDPVVFEYNENGVRILKEVKLWEVSVVTWAMNPEALVTGYKANEAAGRADMMAEVLAADLKEGRKVSAVRLKSLKEAHQTMVKAAKVLKSVISEAEGEKRVASSVSSKVKKSATHIKTIYEITLN